MSLKLTKEMRLRKRAAFRKVFEEGRFLSNPMMVFHFMPNLGQVPRIGFSAGKKLGNAVVRNRCKRRLRECYRLQQAEMPAGVDMVVVARRGMVGAKWDNILTVFFEAFRRSRVLIEKKRSDK